MDIGYGLNSGVTKFICRRDRIFPEVPLYLVMWSVSCVDDNLSYDLLLISGLSTGKVKTKNKMKKKKTQLNDLKENSFVSIVLL